MHTLFVGYIFHVINRYSKSCWTWDLGVSECIKWMLSIFSISILLQTLNQYVWGARKLCIISSVSLSFSSTGKWDLWLSWIVKHHTLIEFQRLNICFLKRFINIQPKGFLKMRVMILISFFVGNLTSILYNYFKGFLFQAKKKDQ